MPVEGLPFLDISISLLFIIILINLNDQFH